MSDRRAAVRLLCVQAILLFTALDLLPMWTDELFTFAHVPESVPGIVKAVSDDNHPPLYFVLAHAWPWHSLAGLRAFSAVWTLAATALFAALWRARAPRFALPLFALSPCLLLYGRMARSYSMATTLVLITVALLERWTRQPRSTALAVGTFAAMTAVMYTHYIPAAAMLPAIAIAGWRPLGFRRVALFLAAIAAAYAPWVAYSLPTVRLWLAASTVSSKYALSGSLGVEHVLKLGYGAVSFAIGESFLGVSLLLVPVVLVLAALGLRAKLFPVGPIAAAALVGYVGVSRLLSYPFMPARLMWLLPFFCLAVAAGIERLRRPWLALVLLVSYATSIGLYFRRENFLNLGYVAPLPEVIATLNREAGPGDLILIDPYNVDYQVIQTGLSRRAPHLLLYPPGVAEARARLGSAARVWVVRNTHDTSPGHSTTAVEAEACAGKVQSKTLLDPYAPWQQTVLKAAGMPLTHFYKITVCR